MAKTLKPKRVMRLSPIQAAKIRIKADSIARVKRGANPAAE